jgi:hypothetical protein
MTKSESSVEDEVIETQRFKRRRLNNENFQLSDTIDNFDVPSLAEAILRNWVSVTPDRGPTRKEMVSLAALTEYPFTAIANWFKENGNPPDAPRFKTCDDQYLPGTIDIAQQDLENTCKSNPSEPLCWRRPIESMADKATPASTYFKTPMSSLGSYRSYRTAPSSLNYSSGAQRSGQMQSMDELFDPSKPKPAHQGGVPDSEYGKLLKDKKLIPDPIAEQNWSGRGQHVEFGISDPIPLDYIAPLGVSMTAKVDKVQCRRITLARKSMMCSRIWSINDAIVEVEHLHRLRHAHIVQLVGTYLQRRTFAILLYPAADCDLSAFMNPESLPQSQKDRLQLDNLPVYLSQFYPCLASALAFVHQNTTRHCDIKPSNILIKYHPLDIGSPYRLYLADFGISQSFVHQDQSLTENFSGRTPKYCAPEVYSELPYSRKADVFSLGCVFMEIYTVAAGYDLEEFENFRRDGAGTDHYHASISQAQSWITDRLSHVPVMVLQDSLHFNYANGSTVKSTIDTFADLLVTMVDADPAVRPSANAVSAVIGMHPCCKAGPGKYVAESRDFGHLELGS